MFVGAAFSLAPAGLGRAMSDSRSQIADGAAKAGLAWAQSRMRMAPAWVAKVTTTTTQPTLLVTETQGQVVGWLQQGNSWSRFRIRFNWQDGPAASTPVTDGLDDPSALWPDFTLLSCNNLQSPVSKNVPSASGPNGSVPTTPVTRISVPNNSALLCVEGTAGTVTTDSAGNPIGFSGQTQVRTIETIVRLTGPGQSVLPSALSSGGDVNVTLGNGVGNISLDSSGTQVTRLRAKGKLSINNGTSPNVYSTLGDLRANSLSNITTNGTPGNVTDHVESATDAFYAIPASKVKTPTSPSQPNAGVYVMNQAGTLTYYNMNYGDYENARNAGNLPTGTTPATIPGATVTTSTTGSPKYTMTFTKDVQVATSGSVSDFAIVPDGGSPTNDTAYDATAATAAVANFWTHDPGWSGVLNNPAYPAWATIFPNLPGVAHIGQTYVFTDSHGNKVTLDLSGGAPGQLISTSGWGSASLPDLTANITATFAPSDPNAAANLAAFNSLATSAGDPNGYHPPVLTPTTSQLTPSDLQVTFKAPSGSSLVVQGTSSGSLYFGAQIQGNGAALVSNHDIQLMGTSTDMSSTPGAALGLNIYAKGNVLIDAFKIDSTGTGSFHGVNMQGVVYSWGNVTVNVGDPSVPASSWGHFSLQGAMVAFGGDPSAGVQPYTGSGSVTVSGLDASIVYDPTYLMDLFQNLPTPLGMEISAWHER